MNSSVECMNRNINLNKYILSSQKKINKYDLKSIGKSFEDNICDLIHSESHDAHNITFGDADVSISERFEFFVP